MTTRLLREEDFEQLYETFTTAFATNAVRFQLSKDDFDYRINKKLLINREISAATFDGNEMVGFILHTSNLYEGIPTAYNGGTGVLPGFRNQRTAEQIYGYLIPKIQSLFLARVILEVVESNEKAIALYEKIGFEARRKFKCYKLEKTLDFTSEHEVFEGEVEDIDFSYNDFHPSFVDSEEQLKRAGEKILLVYDGEENVQGYLVMQPHLGRISQIAVNRINRHKKIGEALIRTAQKYTSKPLFIMNIPEEQQGFDSFLKNCGFQNQVNQYEMELII
ncbi:MAG: GNAT family N-acetyltransferase [Bacteroidota bacterium]